MTALEDAWQAALASEQQAAFGYALLGPQLSGTPRHLAWHAGGAHQRSVDDTSAAMAAAGLTPTPPPADYPQLYPVSGPHAARALAARLEDECAAAWRYLYAVAASTSDPAATARRAEAQGALIASAVRATRWHGSSVPFPGI